MDVRGVAEAWEARCGLVQSSVCVQSVADVVRRGR